MSSASSLLNERIGEIFSELTDIAARAETAAQEGVQVAASSTWDSFNPDALDGSTHGAVVFPSSLRIGSLFSEALAGVDGNALDSAGPRDPNHAGASPSSKALTESESAVLSAGSRLFVSHDNQTFGPHSLEEIRIFLETGDFRPDDACWTTGWDAWHKLSSIDSFRDSGVHTKSDHASRRLRDERIKHLREKYGILFREAVERVNEARAALDHARGSGVGAGAIQQAEERLQAAEKDAAAMEADLEHDIKNINIDTNGLGTESHPRPRVMHKMPREVGYPALLPLAKRKGLFFQSPQGGGAKSEKLLQAIALRILCSVSPGKVKVHLVDFQTKGRAFAILGALDHKIAPIVAPTEEGVSKLLRDMEARVAEVTRRCLTRHEWLTDYNAAHPEEAEDYHLLCLSDFPIGLGKDHLEAIGRLLQHECAARAGVYILFSSEKSLPSSSEFTSFPVVFTEEGKAEVRDGDFDTSSTGSLSDLMLVPDEPPSSSTALVDWINMSSKQVQKVKKVTITVEDHHFWKGSSDDGISVPVGRSGKEDLTLRLGDGAVVHHALVGGATGTGKTVLLHNIILNAAEVYSPQDLQMVLLDFKEGTEFACYENLPHMRILSVASELHFGLSVFEWLVSERMRRAKLFKKVGASNLGDYLEKSGEKMPRILVILDEFQRLLADPNVGSSVSTLLDDLVRTGRSFGINLILSTQSLANVQLESSTLTSVGLRVCLRLSEQECTRFLAYDNVAPTTFTRPGQALYNESEGRREGNTEFQVAFVEAAEIPERCAQLRESEKETFGGAVIEKPRIFFGESPAKTFVLTGIPAEEKVRAYLGEPLQIDASPVAVTLEPRDGANVASIAQNLDILTLLANNLAAQFLTNPLQPNLYILDAFPLAEERWRHALDKGARFIGSPAQLDETLDSLCAELEDRKAADSVVNNTPVVVFLLEPQASRVFPLSTGGDPTPAAVKVSTLLEQGPRHGIHFVLMTTRLSRVDKVLGSFGRFNLDPFSIRIAFKADDGETANFISYQTSTKNSGTYAGVLSDEALGETTNFQIYDEIPMPS
jgi:S-DNA-T family DNA segregation ATPase FtsK/SpoIIIE